MRKNKGIVEISVNGFILFTSMVFAVSALALTYYVAFDRVQGQKSGILGSSIENEQELPLIDVSGTYWKPMLMASKDSNNVFMLIFADYECPFSKRLFSNAIEPLLDEYVHSGFVSYGVVNFPQSFHPQSMNASKYAECVLDSDGDQAYMDTVRKLYSVDITMFQPENYLTGLYDGSKAVEISDCMSKPSKLIENDINGALKLGVNTTPTLVIGQMDDNGYFEAKLISGAYDYDVYSKLLDDYLTR